MICQRRAFSALQIIFLFFFLQENDLRKALIPFIGVSVLLRNSCQKKQENQAVVFIDK
jgi:hypothetical protein